MRKRDSIKFLWDELKSFLPKSYTEEESIKILSILKQAKAMHKTEHFNTWWHEISENEPISFQQYYNETFGGNNKQR